MGARLVLSLAMAMASPDRLVAQLQLRGNCLVGRGEEGGGGGGGRWGVGARQTIWAAFGRRRPTFAGIIFGPAQPHVRPITLRGAIYDTM
jgi:hypothetical protein